MLNEMREGRLTQSSITAFRSLDRPVTFEDGLGATELFPTRAEVEKANGGRMRSLQGETFTFDARDGGAMLEKAQRDRLLANCMAPESIQLKKGAQVMLIKNIDESLVNGSLGKVVGFMDESKFDSYVHTDASGAEALATATASAGATSANAGWVGAGMPAPSRRWPVVRFPLADGTSRDLLCQPETWKVELPNGEVQASRVQVPLILAWAISIHKAQGQTLARVKVDLGNVFEKGQAYVALSRATTMAGLQVLRFDPRKVMAHERVRQFYAQLGRVQLAERNEERMRGLSGEMGGGGGGGGGKKTGSTALGPDDYERRFVEADWGEWA